MNLRELLLTYPLEQIVLIIFNTPLKPNHSTRYKVAHALKVFPNHHLESEVCAVVQEKGKLTKIYLQEVLWY